MREGKKGLVTKPFQIADKPLFLPLVRLRERGKGRGCFLTH